MTWVKAVFIFAILMMFFDTHYIMPNYLPADAQVLHNHPDYLLFKYAVSFAKFFLGIPAILIVGFAGPFQFGYDAWQNFASSAIVYYSFFVPYVAAMMFFIEGESDIPPAYYLFQFFIAKSGKAQLDATTGSFGQTFDTDEFARTVEPKRWDKYQAVLEAKQLEKAAERVRVDTVARSEKVARMARIEEERVEAATNALRAVEANHRMKAKESAYKKFGGKNGSR